MAGAGAGAREPPDERTFAGRAVGGVGEAVTVHAGVGDVSVVAVVVQDADGAATPDVALSRRAGAGVGEAVAVVAGVPDAAVGAAVVERPRTPLRPVHPKYCLHWEPGLTF